MRVAVTGASGGLGRGVVAELSWGPDQAVAPELEGATPAQAETLTGGLPVIVGLAPGTDAGAVSTRLAAAGAGVRWVEATGRGVEVGLGVPPSRLDAVRDTVRGLPGLVFAEVQPPVRAREHATRSSRHPSRAVEIGIV